MNNKLIKIFKPYFNFKKKIIILTKKKKNSKIIERYLANNKIIKLHLGCGARIFKNWLNADINIQADCYIDISQPLPLPDKSVDFIYTEHLIEHLEYFQAKKFFQECCRILKPNGIIRTATPDLNFYLQGLEQEKTGQLSQKYQDFIQHKRDVYKNLVNLPANINSMLNVICRHHSHKYVYNYKTLMQLLVKCGFKNIKQVEAGKSKFPELNNLENNPQTRTAQEIKFHLIQTMAAEAQK